MRIDVALIISLALLVGFVALLLSPFLGSRWHSFLYDASGNYRVGSYGTKKECVNAMQEKREETKYVKAQCGTDGCGDGWKDIMPDCDEMITIFERDAAE